METPLFTQFFAGPIATPSGLGKDEAHTIANSFFTYLREQSFQSLEIRVGFSPSKSQWWLLLSYQGTLQMVRSRFTEHAVNQLYFRRFPGVMITPIRIEMSNGVNRVVPSEEEWIGDSIKMLETVLVCDGLV